MLNHKLCLAPFLPTATLYREGEKTSECCIQLLPMAWIEPWLPAQLTIHYSFASRHELTRDIEWRFCAKILANNSNTIAKVATAVASETTASMTSSQPHELLLQQKQKMRWLGRSKHHIRSQRCESRPLRWTSTYIWQSNKDQNKQNKVSIQSQASQWQKW